MGSKNHKCDALSTLVPEFECEICQESFIAKTTLRVHKAKVHNIVSDSLHCNSCATLFNSMEDLKTHNQRHHEIPPSKKVKFVLPQNTTVRLCKGRLQKKRVKRVTSSLKVGWVGAQNHISDWKEIVTKT